MKKLSTYIFENKFLYLIGIVAMIFGVSLDMLSPQLTKRIIDDVVMDGKMELLTRYLIGILMIGIGRFLFQYIKEYFFDFVSSKISRTIRTDLFHHIQSLSMDFFDHNNTGELMARIKDDVDHIWNALNYIGMLIIEVILHTSTILICMFKLHAKLALLPAIIIPFAGIFAIIMERKLDKIYGEISDENTLLNKVAEENLAGVRTVKAFAREKYEINKFFSHNKHYYDLNMQQSQVFVRYYPLFQFITKLLPILTILLGGFFVIDDSMTIGDLSAFTQYSTNIVWPMEMIGWLANDFSSALASNKKLKEIYRHTPSIKPPKHPIPIKKVYGNIKFEHISFSSMRGNPSQKKEKIPILKDISFQIDAGKTLGIMGATGSGKTSIIHLLERFYEADHGTIFLDDNDIRTLSLKDLRKNIAVVMQDVFLFSDTIAENIVLGKKSETKLETVKESAYKAQASDFIERMEEGYDTVIGERGVGLSGGQKQRISLARALAKKAPILVLDDSTSALDMETEKEIQKTLQTLSNTTKIIIAHRISSVRHADEIIILTNGQITERGTHETLMAKKGYYYQTYLSQYGEPKLQEEAYGISIL